MHKDNGRESTLLNKNRKEEAVLLFKTYTHEITRMCAKLLLCNTFNVEPRNAYIYNGHLLSCILKIVNRKQQKGEVEPSRLCLAVHDDATDVRSALE
jgi:hypothetical protein